MPVLLAVLALLVAPAAARAQAVTYQGDPAHRGAVAAGPAPPLRVAWTRSFEDETTYPVIAEGKVFVVARRGNRRDLVLHALSAGNGRTLWTRDLGPHHTGHAAYDAGRVYVTRASYPEGPGGLLAFAAGTGAPLWESSFTLFSAGPPVATGGNVYINGDGFGNWVGAYRGTDGAELWRAATESGGSGSPAVDGDVVYAALASCPDVYAFRRSDGALLWHPVNDCHGGGGSTPVHHAGRLYVREDDSYPPGDVYEASSGRVLGPMRSDLPPAFAGGLGLFADARLPGETLEFGHVLVARDGNGRERWRFRGDGYLDTAPLVVGRTVYVGSGSGRLYGVSLRTGRVVWRTHLRRPIPNSDDFAGMVTGLAAGEGVLVVPAWRRLVAFRR